MLAQGQSSSAKRGGLAADVSSGLIFLRKKKKKLKNPQNPMCFTIKYYILKSFLLLKNEMKISETKNKYNVKRGC